MFKTIKTNKTNSTLIERIKCKISNFSNEKKSPNSTSENNLRNNFLVKIETFFTLVLNYILLFSSLPFILFVVYSFVDFKVVVSIFDLAPMFLSFLFTVYILFLALSPMLISDLLQGNHFYNKTSFSSFQFKSVYERVFWNRHLKSEEEYLYEEIVKNFISKAKDYKNTNNLKDGIIFSGESKKNFKFNVFFKKFNESFTISFYRNNGFNVESSKENEIPLHFFKIKQKDSELLESLFKKMKEENGKESYQKYNSYQHFTEEKEESINLNNHKQLFLDAISLKIKDMKTKLSYNSNFSILGKVFEVVAYNNNVSILLGHKTVLKTIVVDNSLEIVFNKNFLTLTDSEEDYLKTLFKDVLL